MRTSIFASSSTVTLAYAVGFTSARAQFDPVPLTNNLRIPIEVKEIRITVDSRPLLPGPPPATDLAAAAFIFIDGKFGKDSITSGPVPITIMAPYRLAERSSARYTIETDQTARVETRRIILPRPLILMPGKGFSFTAIMPSSQFFTSPNNFPTTFNAVVTITILGRYLETDDRIPMMNAVPMISYVQLTQANRLSLENELANPLNKTIEIERLVGAIIQRSTAPTLGTTVNDTGTTLELRYPNGDRVCEEPLDFAHGIFGQMRMWPAKFEMPANTRIRAEISLNAADGPDPLIGYQIGFFGTRPEVLP